MYKIIKVTKRKIVNMQMKKISKAVEENKLKLATTRYNDHLRI